MVMLTQLMRFDVADGQGRRARVADLCIALLEDDYPPVTHVLFHYEGKLRQEDWDKVSKVDWRKGRIDIEDLDAATEHDEDDLLLARDVMDALVLDLLGRRTTRVSDLRLKEADGAFRVVGVDAGLAAMIRRVTRGRFGRTDKDSLFDWKYVEFLRGDPSAVDNGAGYRLRINRLPAGEIARLADYVPYLHAAELLKLLPDEKAADVLQAMSIERQLQVIEELPENEAVDLLNRMAPDLATDLIGRLNLPLMRNFISKLPAERRDKIIQLLRYPENSVGGVMTNDLAVLSADICASDAQTSIQEHIKKLDFFSIVFLVDEPPDGILRGTITLRELLAADPNERLDAKMDPYLATLTPFESARDAAYRIVDGQLEAMPVVNAQGRLIGAMTIASAISQLVPPASGLRGVRVFS